MRRQEIGHVMRAGFFLAFDQDHDIHWRRAVGIAPGAMRGGDAGDVNAPTMIEAGLGLNGQLGNGDLWDFLRIRSNAHEIVTVTVTSAADNTDPIQFTLINSSGGSSTPVDILPGSSGTAVLAANQEQFNDIKLLSASANAHSYTLDILVQPENDADSGRDITAELGQALPISSGQVINGTSVAKVNEGGHDNDCYAIDLPANAQLSVPVSSPVEQPYPESYASVELYGPEGNYIWGATTSPGGMETLEHTADATGGIHTLCATTFEYYPIGYYSFTPTVAGQ